MKTELIISFENIVLSIVAAGLIAALIASIITLARNDKSDD